MLDNDSGELYQDEELEEWKSQIVISNKEVVGIREIPFAFTEQGVSMLAGILKVIYHFSHLGKLVRSMERWCVQINMNDKYAIFEEAKRLDDQNNEFWSARDLSRILNYSEYSVVSILETTAEDEKEFEEYDKFNKQQFRAKSKICRKTIIGVK